MQSVAIVGEPVPPETVLHAGMATPLTGLAETPQWHAVATSPELHDGPLGVEVDGTAWVVARLDDEVVAFEDRCPHRLAPLSAGRVEGGRLRCPYHGWEFDRHGRCTLIPSNGPGAPIPARAQLRSI